MMDCVLSGSLLVVFSLFCYVMCVFFEQINSLSLSLSGLCVGHTGVLCTNRLTDRKDAASRVNRPLVLLPGVEIGPKRNGPMFFSLVSYFRIIIWREMENSK